MASLSTIVRLSFSDDSLTGPGASDALRHPVGFARPLVAVLPMLLVSLHGAPALAGDIAQNTPAASMALATGLYAAPGQSAAVSTVQTPSVTTSPLPEQAPPASVSVPAPAVIAAAAPLASPPATTTEWTNYVTVIASLVGALAGIAGMIMGGLALRRVSRRRRY